ncbi:PREDICTED: 39S ribosomal protein L43, mitochondrial [Nicrophorus vespilloides]|uniref:Large ribosomal subunit protein mL43 n=1 Tax=Nicrophorus vespilloides TaxID=110193 RepID=A0ABM1N1L6_NICVS|nr:PREDICTED: 39S ribosomal protein L43, mitochondrial [Nicrophorus vespilloides]
MSNSHLLMKAGFITSPAQNGVGRYVCQLQRVVLKFCKNNGSSRGVRDFIESDLVNFAKDHPGVVVYLKPRRHRGPVIVAEYLNGEKQHVYCRNFTSEVVSKWLTLLKNQQGNHEGMRLRKMWHTDHPSIQGPWTPYTFREPSLNLAEFPNDKLSSPASLEPSATDRLIEAFKKQQLKELE